MVLPVSKGLTLRKLRTKDKNKHITKDSNVACYINIVAEDIQNEAHWISRCIPAANREHIQRAIRAAIVGSFIELLQNVVCHITTKVACEVLEIVESIQPFLSGPSFSILFTVVVSLHDNVTSEAVYDLSQTIFVMLEFQINATTGVNKIYFLSKISFHAPHSNTLFEPPHGPFAFQEFVVPHKVARPLDTTYPFDPGQLIVASTPLEIVDLVTRFVSKGKNKLFHLFVSNCHILQKVPLPITFIVIDRISLSSQRLIWDPRVEELDIFENIYFIWLLLTVIKRIFQQQQDVSVLINCSSVMVEYVKLEGYLVVPSNANILVITLTCLLTKEVLLVVIVGWHDDEQIFKDFSVNKLSSLVSLPKFFNQLFIGNAYLLDYLVSKRASSVTPGIIPLYYLPEDVSFYITHDGQPADSTFSILLFVLFCLHLEDKVLIEDGGIVMNEPHMPEQVEVFGPESDLYMGRWSKQPNKRVDLVWDPG